MSDLIDEIRAARQVLRQRDVEASDAGFTLRACKEQQKKARAELDKLLDELETGQSRYSLPGFDRLEMPAASPNGTYDEYQRGPTEFPTSTVSLGPRQGTPARAAGPGSAPGAKARKAAK
jgi:hypothetical protein